MRKKINKRFLYFDKSRWIIFTLVFLLLPILPSYPSTPCGLLRPPGFFLASCTIIKPAFILIPLALIDYFFYGYITLQGMMIISLFIVINLVLSLILSYPLNLIYHKIKAKYRR